MGVEFELGDIIGLRQLQPGQKGIIAAINADGELGRRIRDMGLIPGTTVEMKGHAPLWDPVALRVSGVTLALRNKEADYIMVRALSVRPDQASEPEALPLPAIPFNGICPSIALAGNPNCGKTTAFNKYTGTRQHVGNYPGVTVDRKEGVAHADGETLRIVDLPGTYSLTAYSQEELISRTELTNNPPLAVINIVDSSALERNMLLTVQLMEMGVPIVLACNMIDEAHEAGIRLDIALLKEKLGVPVVETVARTGSGLDEALRQALAFGREGEHKPFIINYGSDLDPVLLDMQNDISSADPLGGKYNSRWVALKILEGDEVVRGEVQAANPDLYARLHQQYDKVAQHIRDTLKTSPEAVISDYRYGYIRGVLKGVVAIDETKSRLAMTDKLDKVFVHPLLGPVLMVVLMYLMFVVTFQVGAYPQGWVEIFCDWLGGVVSNLLPEGLLRSLVVSGLIDGVGGVLSFVPLIMIMFLFIAFLEDSGYMARIAYMVDRVFRAFGLHGVSVMPYIISGGIAGGCAIPGAMATRTLRSPTEKLATLLTLPFMTCGAKLPVFILLVGAFFPDHGASALLLLILSGWLAALLVAKLLRSTIIRGEATPFVMELPPYRMPTLRSVLTHCWERSWLYIKKAGTVLVAISIVIWACLTFPDLGDEASAPYLATIAGAEQRLGLYGQFVGAEQEDQLEKLQAEVDQAHMDLAEARLRNSVAGRMGAAIEPLTRPAGFDWRVDVALIGGIAAKEALVSTLGTAYSLGEVDPGETSTLAGRLEADPSWSKATAVALMFFVLLYSPCFVALIIIRQESGSWKWLLFSMVFNTLLAYVVAVIAYQIGCHVWT